MDEKIENKTENNEDELFIVYKKNTVSSFYLGKLLEGQQIKKGIINRDIVISSLGEYNMMFSMNSNLDRIVKLLLIETGLQEITDNQNNEPKSLLDKGNQFYKPKFIQNKGNSVSLQSNMKRV